MLTVLDHVTFDDLLNLAYSSARLRYLIGDHYLIPKYRIHERAIRIDGLATPDESIGEIFITGFIPALRFLRSYGSYIKELSFYGSYFKPDEIPEISRYIGDYCAETLTSLELIETDSYLFTSDTNVAFTNVVSVDIWYFQPLDDIPIHRIYPAVEYLTIASKLFSPNAIANLDLSLNVNLRSIDIIDYVTFKLLHSISISRPNLDVLKFIYDSKHLYSLVDSDDDEIITFGHVKNLTVTMYSGAGHETGPFPVQFKALDSLVFDSTQINDVTINLIEQNVGLKALSLPTVSYGMNDLNRIFDSISRLEHLEEILLHVSGSIRAPVLMGKINAVHQLKRVIFRTVHQENRDILIDAANAQWQVENAWETSDSVEDVFYLAVIRRDSLE